MNKCLNRMPRGNAQEMMLNGFIFPFFWETKHPNHGVTGVSQFRRLQVQSFATQIWYSFVPSYRFWPKCITKFNKSYNYVWIITQCFLHQTKKNELKECTLGCIAKVCMSTEMVRSSVKHNTKKCWKSYCPSSRISPSYHNLRK